MKFTTSRTELYIALSIVGKAVSKTGIIPVLNSYLLEIDNNVLTVSACDTENFLSYKMDCTAENICIAVPASILVNYIKELPEQPLVFEVKDGILTVIAKTGKCKIPFEDGKDFPKIAHTKGELLTIESGTFLDCISKSAFAVGTNHVVAGLNYLLLSFGKQSLTYVGCQGNIMSVQNSMVSAKKALDILVTVSSLSILTALPFNEQIQISISENSICVKMNDSTEFVCLLSGEKYPDYKNVIPVGNDKSIELDRIELLSALRRLQLFAVDVNNDFTLRLSDTISLSARNLKSEEADEIVSGTYSGEPFEIKLKCGLAISCLNKIDTPTVTFTFSEFNKAGLIKFDESENLMMIMPVV